MVHNWEAELDLFRRLEKNDSLRNSQTWYQSFYAQANTSTIGGYVRVREQFKNLLSLSSEERQSADTLQASIQKNLKALNDIGKAYSQASTEADSIMLEADWMEQYGKLNKNFANWHQLSADIRQRIESNIPVLQQANAALPTNLLPATTEKLMNAIQLRRILGKPISEKQQTHLYTWAFSCPLKAGNAVYRARSLLRTMGNYVFDDAALCQLNKEENVQDIKIPDVSVDVPHNQWQIYPNPTREKVWFEGPNGASLAKILLYDHLGRVILTEQGNAHNKQVINLPTHLSAGIYFIILEQPNGNRQTSKLIIEP